MPTILEDYFDFSEPEEIRIQDHRIWLHHVLKEYLVHKLTFEALCERFETLSKDEILACLLYYHRNKKAMDRYLKELEKDFQRCREESRQKHGDWLERLRERAATEKARKSNAG